MTTTTPEKRADLIAANLKEYNSYFSAESRAHIDYFWSIKWLHENGYVTYWPVSAENGKADQA